MKYLQIIIPFDFSRLLHRYDLMLMIICCILNNDNKRLFQLLKVVNCQIYSDETGAKNQDDILYRCQSAYNELYLLLVPHLKPYADKGIFLTEASYISACSTLLVFLYYEHPL